MAVYVFLFAFRREYMINQEEARKTDDSGCRTCEGATAPDRSRPDCELPDEGETQKGSGAAWGLHHWNGGQLELREFTRGTHQFPFCKGAH